MADRKAKDRYKNVDFFARIACGGNKKLITRIPRMAEIEPLSLNREELSEAKNLGVRMPDFDIEKEYDNFIAEKRTLREYYEPFLKQYQRQINSPVTQQCLIDFSYRESIREHSGGQTERKPRKAISKDRRFCSTKTSSLYIFIAPAVTEILLTRSTERLTSSE